MSDIYAQYKERGKDFIRCDRCLKPFSPGIQTIISFKEYPGFTRRLEICPSCSDEIKSVIFTKKSAVKEKEKNDARCCERPNP